MSQQSSSTDGGKPKRHKLRGGSEQRYKPEVVKQAILDAGGNVSAAARMLRCSRQTVINYMERYPEVKVAREEAKEIVVDMAESKLISLIEQGVPAAIFFTLRTWGKDRGFTTRHEHTGEDGSPINISVSPSEAARKLKEAFAQYAGDALDSSEDCGLAEGCEGEDH